ncbi:hypothetical protein HKX48_009526 [Thoreauomyces humboldtii]|nr:hypothetical protein HKX48_009526 [Thoreauomyces humboldtii]
MNGSIRPPYESGPNAAALQPRRIDPSALQHGEILHISEIVSSQGSNAPVSVRVLGTLVAFDSTNSLALIDHLGARLTVDAQLLGPFHHRLKSLLQFIGEIDRQWVPPPNIAFEPPRPPRGPGMVLRARIVRNVDGLDVPLYDQALQIRRKFDAQRGSGIITNA